MCYIVFQSNTAAQPTAFVYPPSTASIQASSQPPQSVSVPASSSQTQPVNQSMAPAAQLASTYPFPITDKTKSVFTLFLGKKTNFYLAVLLHLHSRFSLRRDSDSSRLALIRDRQSKAINKNPRNSQMITKRIE